MSERMFSKAGLIISDSDWHLQQFHKILSQNWIDINNQIQA